MMHSQNVALAADERRRHPRYRTLKSGKLIYNRRMSVMDCIVRNISDGGACVQVANAAWIPEGCELSIPVDGVWRSCRVRWRASERIGVQFQ